MADLGHRGLTPHSLRRGALHIALLGGYHWRTLKLTGLGGRPPLSVTSYKSLDFIPQ